MKIAESPRGSGKRTTGRNLQVEIYKVMFNRFLFVCVTFMELHNALSLFFLDGRGWPWMLGPRGGGVFGSEGSWSEGSGGRF